MSETCFQFRVDGRAGNSPIRNTWAEAAADAVRAGYASWRKCGIEIAFDPTSGGEIARLPGKDAEIASLRAQLDEAKERAHYATGVAETNIKRANEAADEARRKAIEECAAVVIAMREGFLSPEYATGQPLSSMNERIACSMILNNLTALLSESKT